jgi:hypothetical protein
MWFSMILSRTAFGADERKQTERDVLEALGDYKSDTGVSVENASAGF